MQTTKKESKNKQLRVWWKGILWDCKLEPDGHIWNLAPVGLEMEARHHPRIGTAIMDRMLANSDCSPDVGEFITLESEA